MKHPLILTLSRLLISPIFLVLYLYHDSIGITALCLPFVLIGLMIISELTDILDGYLARKWKMVTDLGKVLDPMADSITRITVLFTLTQGPVQLPMLLVFVFLYRDLMISTLRTVCALRGHALAARLSGKIKTVMLAVVVFMILILMIPYSRGVLSLEQLQLVSTIILSVAAVYTLFSGVEYVYAHRKVIKDAWK